MADTSKKWTKADTKTCDEAWVRAVGEDWLLFANRDARGWEAGFVDFHDTIEEFSPKSFKGLTSLEQAQQEAEQVFQNYLEHNLNELKGKS